MTASPFMNTEKFIKQKSLSGADGVFCVAAARSLEMMSAARGGPADQNDSPARRTARGRASVPPAHVPIRNGAATAMLSLPREPP